MRIVYLSDRTKARPADLHQIPDAGIGKGVPLQPLPDQETADRNRTRTLSLRETDQNMVPEPANEVEEGEQEQGRRWRWPGPGWRWIHGRNVLTCSLTARRSPDGDVSSAQART